MRVEPIPLYRVGDDAGSLLRELSSRHIDRAYRLAWAILGNDADAQDAAQDTLTAAWRKRRTLRDPEKFEAWFTAILVNVCRDRLRSRSRNQLRPLETAHLTPIGDMTDAAHERDELGRALASLDPDHRIVVVLRYWADLTVDDIAERLGVPAGTVKSRLHYSLRTLRTALEEIR